MSWHDINLFYDIMLDDREIQNSHEQEEFEASYFAMCLLIPEESITKIIEAFGGFERCFQLNYIKGLSELYMVEEKLMFIRLVELKRQKEKKWSNANLLSPKCRQLVKKIK